MDDTKNFDLTMPLTAEDKQERVKEDCKNIADLFEASATDMFEGQNGPIFHLEFDDAEKFEKFSEYLRAHGSLPVDSVQTKSGEVH
jgi:hypothetical protein